MVLLYIRMRLMSGLTLTEGESLLLGVPDRSGLHLSTFVRSLRHNSLELFSFSAAGYQPV